MDTSAASSSASPTTTATTATGTGSRGISAFSSLPVLRLPPRGCPPEEEAAFCARLREVCHTIGFFYVADIEEYVKPATCDAAIDAAQRFFALPDAAKAAIDNRGSPAFRGYIRLGAENTAGRPDFREQIEFGVEAAQEPASPTAPPYRRLIGPNRWPDDAACPGFKPTILDFLDGMGALSQRLMELLALSLDLPREFFDPTFGDEPNVQMKIARYPPAPPEDDTEEEESGKGKRRGGGKGSVGRFGVGAHTDSGYLSILLQDHVGGLQVQNGAGDWIDAHPVPGSMVVNLGEMLQLCTRGYYLATPHRVVSKAGAGVDRISVPYFWNPRLDAVIAPIDPLPDTLRWSRPRPAEVGSTASHGSGGNRLLGVYGANALKSLARSHPEVMSTWHPDLEVKPDGTVVRREEAATPEAK